VGAVETKEKSFHLITTTEGCATNLLENATYRENMKLSGMKNTSDPSEADVLVINTCGYTTEREIYSTNMIEKYSKEYPNKKIVVGGCLTKINPEKISTVYNGPTFLPGDVKQLNEILGISPDQEIVSHANFFDSQDFTYLSPTHLLALKMRPYYYRFEELFSGKKLQPLHNVLKTAIVNNDFFSVTVSQGCLGKCTFCAIKTAKGEVKSRGISDIINDFKKGLSLGHKNFWLVGDDIGCYGYDLGLDFSDLLERILKIDADFNLVINYFEPYWFVRLFDKMKHQLKDKRILNINFPLQSGSFRIVRNMGREYDPKLVLEKIKVIKKENPELVIKTNIIVGFPGEKWMDFFRSMKSIFAFDAVLAISFTSRPGTGAAKYKNHLSERMKKLRMMMMNTAVFIRHTQVLLGSLLQKENF
jgi:threonylcarbamoyladenosine tRNA methylthiotransferase CDKAL1